MKYAFIERNRRVWPISVQWPGARGERVPATMNTFARRRHILERRHLSG